MFRLLIILVLSAVITDEEAEVWLFYGLSCLPTQPCVPSFVFILLFNAHFLRSCSRCNDGSFYSTLIYVLMYYLLLSHQFHIPMPLRFVFDLSSMREKVDPANNEAVMDMFILSPAGLNSTPRLLLFITPCQMYLLCRHILNTCLILSSSCDQQTFVQQTVSKMV